MNTLGQSEYDIQSYALEEEKCAGGCTSHSGQRVLCDQQVPCVTKALFSESILWPNPQPTWKPDERTGKRGVEDELPQVCFSQNTPPLQAGSPLLKGRRHCHGHKDVDAKAIEVIRSTQRSGGYT